MSQYISTTENELEQIASNNGWSDFCEWVGTLDVDKYPSIAHLALHGFDNDADMIFDELNDALNEHQPKDDIRDVAQQVLDFCDHHEDAEIILVSNGVTADDESEDEE